MHRVLRIGLIVALLAMVVGWAGSGTGVAAQGTTYTDTMDSAANGLLSGQSPDTSQFAYGYQNGQFIIKTLNTGWSGDLLAFASVPALADSSVAVDFSIAGDLTGKYAFVGCRGGDNDTGYIFEVFPGSGLTNLWRFDSSSSAVNLATATDTASVNIGSANNNIQITCQGSTITGTVNGNPLLTVQDGSFASGESFIGTGKTSDTTDTLLTGFDNLTITDLGGSAPAQPTTAAQPTQAGGFPTAIPAQATTPAQPTEAAGFPTAIPVQPTTSSTTGTGDQSGDMVITDPRVDPNATLVDAQLVSVLAAPVAGPFQASADIESGNFKYLSSDVNLSEFYTSLHFTTPPSTPAGEWSVGFVFWEDAQGNSYDLFIQAKGTAAKWGFGQQTAGAYTVLQSGDLAAGAVDFTPGADNYLGLTLSQGIVLLSGNDFNLAAQVDLGASTGTGNVNAEVGFLADDTTTTQTLPMSISSFAVWDLSPTAVAAVFSTDQTPSAAATEAGGFPTAIPAVPTEAPAAPTVASLPTQAGVAPTAAGSTGANPILTQIFNQERSTAMATAPIFTSASGSLTQSTAGFDYVPAGASVTDFYATATFVNPTDLSTLSDVGIGFRDLNTNSEFRFVVRSDGAWAVVVAGSGVLAQGSLTNFDATPGASNTLEVIAQGATGLVAVNGEVIQQIDLSSNLNAGDVYIASGMTNSATVEGRQTPYSNFVVYQLGA